MFGIIKKWRAQRKETRTRAKRQIKNYKTRSLVLEKRLERVETITQKLDARNKIIGKLFKEIPLELEKPGFDAAKVKRLEILLGERIRDSEQTIIGFEKTAKTAKALGQYDKIIAASIQITKGIIAGDKRILEKLQKWKRKTGNEWRF